jgi:hypothetical protein
VQYLGECLGKPGDCNVARQAVCGESRKKSQECGEGTEGTEFTPMASAARDLCLNQQIRNRVVLP